jgi:hypothetical protein
MGSAALAAGDSGEELLGGLPDLGARAELDRLLELVDRLLPLGRPREQVAEVVVDDLALREARRQRAEVGEGRRDVVLVEEADGPGDERLDVPRLLPRRVAAAGSAAR